MATALYPRLGTTQLTEDGATITAVGVLVTTLTDYYLTLIRKAELLTANPIPDAGEATTIADPQRTDDTAVSITAFGAVGDGVANDTAAIQAAIDSGAGTVLIPTGTFSCGNLNLRANLRVQGTGWASVLTFRPGSSWLMSANSFSAGTTNPADNMRGIVLSNFQARGLCDTVGFAEHNHLINLNAVSDVLVEGLLVKGFQGDGLYIGSSNIAAVERHNENVTVRKCYFDGINAENRNGISIIDCTGLLIDDCDFVNCVKDGQPGSVDFEPDPYNFARIRSCTVQNCRMTGGNGAGVACLLQPQSFNLAGIGPITIRNNVIKDKPIGFTFFGDNAASAAPADSEKDYNVTWEGNHVSGGEQSFIFSGVKGGRLLNNTFTDMTTYGEFGYTTGCTDVLVQNNSFIRLATTQTTGIALRWCKRLRFVANRFEDIGNASGVGGRGVGVLSGVNTYVSFRDNTWIAPTSKLTQLMLEVGGTFDNGTCEYDGNANPANIGNPTLLNKGTASSIPVAGTWARGNVVYHSSPATSGFLGWVCVAAGTPGTWKTFGVIES